MELIGIHHVTAITKNASANRWFYTEVLGMRLVKKTVNQDNTSVYHLFYGDEAGRPGTALTFFENPNVNETIKGMNRVSSTSLRIPDDHTLMYWQDRLNLYGVNNDGITNEADRKVIHFNDPEGHSFTLVSDEINNGVAGGIPHEHKKIPKEKGITGLGPIKLTVKDKKDTITILTKLLSFQQIGSYSSPLKNQSNIIILSTGEGGTGAEIHVEERKDLPNNLEGYGSVHHVAFRVKNEEELKYWRNRLEKAQMPNSGIVDRFYFKSVYFRELNGILFELATDDPGFTIDEPIDKLGETLSLSPYLEGKRNTIEKKLNPLNTVEHKQRI